MVITWKLRDDGGILPNEEGGKETIPGFWDGRKSNPVEIRRLGGAEGSKAGYEGIYLCSHVSLVIASKHVEYNIVIYLSSYNICLRSKSRLCLDGEREEVL